MSNLTWTEWQPNNMDREKIMCAYDEVGSVGYVTYHLLPYEAEWNGIYLGHFATLEEAQAKVAENNEQWRNRE